MRSFSNLSMAFACSGPPNLTFKTRPFGPVADGAATGPSGTIVPVALYDTLTAPRLGWRTTLCKILWTVTWSPLRSSEIVLTCSPACPRNQCHLATQLRVDTGPLQGPSFSTFPP